MSQLPTLGQSDPIHAHTVYVPPLHTHVPRLHLLRFILGEGDGEAVTRPGIWGYRGRDRIYLDIYRGAVQTDNQESCVRRYTISSILLSVTGLLWKYTAHY